MTCFVLHLHVCRQNCVSILFCRLHDKFKRARQEQGGKKALAMASVDVVTNETKERANDFFAAIPNYSAWKSVEILLIKRHSLQ